MTDLGVEVEQTLRVAVCSAAGVPRAHIPSIMAGASMPMSDLEVKMSFARLKKITKGWRE